VNILVINDDVEYVKLCILWFGFKGTINVTGITFWNPGQQAFVFTPHPVRVSEEDMLKMTKDADVILLDHQLSGWNLKTGDQVIAYFVSQGVDLTSKRLVGNSSGGRALQPYVEEHVYPNLKDLDNFFA
jgi:hypothetical protein